MQSAGMIVCLLLACNPSEFRDWSGGPSMARMSSHIHSVAPTAPQKTSKTFPIKRHNSRTRSPALARPFKRVVPDLSMAGGHAGYTDCTLVTRIDANLAAPFPRHQRPIINCSASPPSPSPGSMHTSLLTLRTLMFSTVDILCFASTCIISC